MMRLALFVVALLALLAFAGCSSQLPAVKPAAPSASAELPWLHLVSGPCPAPYQGGLCAVGRAAAAYSASMGIALAGATAEAELTGAIRRRVSSLLRREEGGSVPGGGTRSRAIDVGKRHVEVVTTAIMSGVSVPEWTFVSSTRAGDVSGGEYTALARVSDDLIKDARSLLEQTELDPEEKQGVLQAYDLYIDDLERQRAATRSQRR